MLVCFSSYTCQVSLKARVTMSRSFEFTSGSFQKYSWRPCTHSKYETTTPPALARMSGRTSTPLSSRISSAAGVIGPFAPSQTICAFTWAALSPVITCSSAHGASTSQSSSSSSSFVISSAPFRPASEPVSCLCAIAAATSIPFGLCSPPRRVGDGDHGRAFLGEELGQEAADVAEALHGDGQVRQLQLLLPHRFLDAVERAARGRLEPPERAADVERLAGDDAEHRVALVHRVGVEDPGHHRAVGADVGRRDVLLGPDLVDDLRREAAGHALELAARELLRIADDAALGAAERDVHQRALPGHPHRERLDLVERDVRVVADAALGRAARDVVGDAVALEGLDRAVVHRHRDRDDDGLLALLQDVHQALVDLEDVGHAAQLRAGDLERILAEVGLGGFDGRHLGPLLGRKRAEYRSLSDRERDRPDGRRRLARRCRDEPHAVAARVEQGAVRVASGEADTRRGRAAGRAGARAGRAARRRARARRPAGRPGGSRRRRRSGRRARPASESTAGVGVRGLERARRRARPRRSGRAAAGRT